MPTELIIFGYVVILLSALLVVSLYSEQRRKRFDPTPSQDRIFRCGGCGCVYTDDADVERSRCPQCGNSNEAIVF